MVVENIDNKDLVIDEDTLILYKYLLNILVRTNPEILDKFINVLSQGYSLEEEIIALSEVYREVETLCPSGYITYNDSIRTLQKISNRLGLLIDIFMENMKE